MRNKNTTCQFFVFPSFFLQQALITLMVIIILIINNNYIYTSYKCKSYSAIVKPSHIANILG